MENLSEHGRFLTLAAPRLPVPLAPSSYQLLEKPQPSDQTPVVRPFSFDGNGGRVNIPRSRKPKASKKDSFVNVEVEPGLTIRLRQNLEHDMDPKTLKRIVSNRVSAQKSRLKKLQYVAYLEKQAEELETRIALLGPQVAHYRDYKHFLEVEQADLNRQIADREEHAQSVEAEIVDNRGEVTRLMKKLTIQQQTQTLEVEGQTPVLGNGLSEHLAHPNTNEPAPNPPVLHPRQP